MGRPNIDVVFKELASTVIKRSSNGVAALIIKDNTDKTFSTVVISSEDQIDELKFTAENVSFIKDVLLGGVIKVIVSRVDVEEVEVIETGVNQIANIFYNWIAIADGTSLEHTELSVKVKSMDSIQSVVFNIPSDHERIVNFANTSVTKESGVINGEKYIARVLGLICGCNLTESTTYKILDDLISVVEPIDIDTAVDQGQFLLFNDEEVVRVARGVNSLLTIGENKTDDMKKITIMETLLLIQRDIKSSFKNLYIGKYKNNYDNQVIFFSAVNDYLNVLAYQEILENNYNNHVEIDIEAQKNALAIIKPEVIEWSDKEIKNYPYRSSVFAKTYIRVNDAIEDLNFNLYLV
ncbi:phage tail sheath C-terminal domain-containing protein [Helicovermis profundi]|uniref:Phage tail sheath subtilisin-like domain-containing protein n=1 Tax=Helicovermis profundi TaxID=3065157 RepID=A0AAU9ELA6_9FIRM|nr:phage tail sheath subtilisin-like domain-containing protein [Clostridia bacterium S502]